MKNVLRGPILISTRAPGPIIISARAGRFLSAPALFGSQAAENHHRISLGRSGKGMARHSGRTGARWQRHPSHSDHSTHSHWADPDQQIQRRPANHEKTYCAGRTLSAPGRFGVLGRSPPAPNSGRSLSAPAPVPDVGPVFTSTRSIRQSVYRKSSSTIIGT